MRDGLIIVVLAVVLAVSLFRPWIGVMAWTMTSLGSPHHQFGYASRDWPVAMGIAICTMLGLLMTRQRQNPLVGFGPWTLLLFVIWICITLPASIYFDESYPLWERSMKIFLMLFVSMALITDVKKLHVFIWINVVSIAYYGVKGGVFTLTTGGNYRVWGTGGFIEGNNELAVALVTIVPLMRYLQLRMVRKWAIHTMSASMLLCIVAAVGTQSRGALIALAALGAFFWIKSPNKIGWGVALTTLVVAGLALMPEQWWERMGTIKSYEEDGSALGRINAWWVAWNLAKDKILGGGFMIYNPGVFARYAPVPDDVHAAHSIYFQIMGEHGFVGLALFLAIGASTWFAARRLAKLAKKTPSLKWAKDLAPMIQVSLIAFASGGAFLSLAYFDLPYNVMAIVVLAVRFASLEVPKPARSMAPDFSAVQTDPMQNQRPMLVTLAPDSPNMHQTPPMQRML